MEKKPQTVNCSKRKRKYSSKRTLMQFFCSSYISRRGINPIFIFIHTQCALKDWGAHVQMMKTFIFYLLYPTLLTHTIQNLISINFSLFDSLSSFQLNNNFNISTKKIITWTISPCSCPDAVNVRWHRNGIRCHCGVGTCIW